MAPRRIQLRRTKGWRKPPSTITVARPTRWGNPFTIDDAGSRDEAVARYRAWIAEPEQAEVRQRARQELAGKDLACWCPTDGPCHGDVLLAIANP